MTSGAQAAEAASTTERAARLLKRAAEAAKCGPCGCAHGAVSAVVASSARRSGPLAEACNDLRARLVEVRYDCLGCRVCWPADALGMLGDAGLVDSAPACPTEAVAVRAGWPPLPGSYSAVRWRAPVAICTLGDSTLAATLVQHEWPEVAIVGTLATENLGIERLIRNTVANPNLRFLVVAGAETRSAVGHLPGASLLALASNGVADTGRIIGSPSRRPMLLNVSAAEVAQFRRAVEVVDLIGEVDPATIADAVRSCGERDPGPAVTAETPPSLEPVAGYLSRQMVPDPAGYLVIYLDLSRQLLVVEHYSTDGLLDLVVEGTDAASTYTPLIDRGVLSRLDHAAYLGRELARADIALSTSTSYVQDAAPEARGRMPGSQGTSCCS